MNGPSARQVTNQYEVPFWAGKQRLGNVGLKAVLYAMASHADEVASCSPSQELLADETDQSVSTVYRQIKQLARWGLIVVEPRYVTDNGKKVRTSNRYFLQIDASFDIRVQGRDYDASVQGSPDLPVNLTGRSAPEGVHLPVNLTVRCDQGEELVREEMSGSPTGHGAPTYRSAVTDEQVLKALEQEQKNSLSAKAEREPGVHAPRQAREDNTPPPLFDDEDEICEAADTKEAGRNSNSSIPEPESPDRARSRMANDLGRRWHEHCSDRQTPFPSSLPGTKFTKYAEFTQMLRMVLLTYSDPEEVWRALTAIYDQRAVVFPSRAELERQLAFARRSALAVVGKPGEIVTDDDVRRAAEVQETIDAMITWWTVKERHAVLASEAGKLRALIAEAFAQGFEARPIAEALRACGRSVPPPWDFGDALTLTARGVPAAEVAGALASGGKPSAAERRKLQQEKNHASWDAMAAAMMEAQQSGAQSDGPCGKIIIGEVS